MPAGSRSNGLPEAGSAAPSCAVTVIALCFNHARYVIECLDSIGQQTCQDFQLIVTDDASSDDSAELIADWLARHRPDAIFLRHRDNVGLCATLNEALACATGSYISMIATDDAWQPHKIAHQLAAMRVAGPEVAVVYSDASQMDEAGERLPQDFLAAHLGRRAAPSGAVFSALVNGNFVPAMATLIRRDALTAIGGYDERLTYEDYDMWLRLAAHHEFLFVPGIVARYRIVSTSMVRRLWRTPTPDHLHSELLIREKWLRSGGLSVAQRAEWQRQHHDFLYQLYVADDRRAAVRMMRTAIIQYRPRYLALAIGLAIGLTRTRGKRLASRLAASSPV